MSDPIHPERAVRRRLAPPLRGYLRAGVDERSVSRMWRAIDARTAPGAERRSRSAAWLLASLLAVLLGGVGWQLVDWRSAPTLAISGVLVTRDGQRFDLLEAPAEGAARQVTLADGSRIEAEPGARVEGLASTPSEFVLLLRRGRARFSVTPGGPRRWLIETRAGRVEVVGTLFWVDAGAEEVRVHVEEGAVLVRSPELPDGVRRLDAGHSLSLGVRVEPAADAVHSLLSPRPAPEAPDAGEAPGRAVVGSAAHAGRARSQPRRSQAARPGASSAQRLWAAADRARRAGDAARAARLLERLLREHPRDSQAGLGAFSLGALYLEQLEQPQLAAQAFRRALDLDIPAPLREDCYRRWAESARAAGDRAGVARAVEEYARDFPTGRQLPELRALLGEAAPAPGGPPWRLR